MLKSSRLRDNCIRAIGVLAVVGACIGGWQIFVTTSGISPDVVPPVGSIWSAFVSELSSVGFWSGSIAVTAEQTLIGFGVAVVVGVFLGVVTAKSRFFNYFIRPLVIAAQVTPVVAIIPVLIIIFGFGIQPKVIIAALLAFFPILTNTTFGINSVPERLIDLFRVLEVPSLHRLVRLELRYSLPAILTGCEVGMVLATIGAIVGEYLAGSSGLGRAIISYQNNLQVPDLYGAIVVTVILGLVLFGAIRLVRMWLIPWYRP